MSIDTEDPPRGGDLDPLDGAGAVVVPVLVALAGVVGFALFVALH